MKAITTKLLWLLIWMLLLWMACAASAGAADVSITIDEDNDTDATIQTKINVALDEVGSTGTVTVTGIFHVANETLEMDIPEGVTVQWNASFQTLEPEDGLTLNDYLIHLTGNGTLEIASMGYISHSGSGRTIQAEGAKSTVIVSGGGVAANTGGVIYMTGQEAKVWIKNSGYIYNQSTTNVQPAVYLAYGRNSGETNVATEIIIDHGSVATLLEEGNDYAIQTYGNVEVSNGSHIFVSGPRGRAINALGPNSVVTVKENSAVWTTTGIAIRTEDEDAQIIISDTSLVYNEAIGNTYPVIYSENGIVSVENDAAVAALGGLGGVAISAKNVTVASGGMVFGYGDESTDVIKGSVASLTGKGVVVAWNGDKDTYNARTTDDLNITITGGESSPVAWKQVLETNNNNEIEEKGGITYGNSSSCFLDLHVDVIDPSVTVGDQSVPLTTGTAGTATFPVTTTDIADNASPYEITWYASKDAEGVSISAPPGITATLGALLSGTATLTVTSTGSAAAETYYFTVTIDGTKSNIAELKVSPAPTEVPSIAAQVADVTVGGVVGSPLPAGQTATLTLTGGTVRDALQTDASGWFTNLPEGIVVTATAETGSSSILLTFSGTPSTAVLQIFHLIIPDSVVTGGADVPVEINTNAKFHVRENTQPPSILPATGDSFPMGILIMGLGIVLAAMGLLKFRLNSNKRQR